MRRCLNCMNEYPEEYQDICPQCGYVDGKTQDGTVYLMPGSILQGRYIVGTVISARDVDVTYHGWDALFERKVQIQEYFPKYCATRAGKSEVSIYDSKLERYEEGLKLFCRQSRELIRLYKENDIVTYHACFQENKTAYAITDDRTDKTLGESLQGRPRKVRDALSLLWDVIESVEKCHGIGVYHGLIGVNTFWMTGEGKLILKDFGSWRYVSGEPGIVDYGKANIHTDVYRIARLFCLLVTGKEIEDGENLEAELLKKQLTLNSAVLAALRHALSHDTKSLGQFRQELYERGVRRRGNGNSRVKMQRKNARKSLALPRWVTGSAAAAVIAIAVFTVLVASGTVKLKIRSEESHLGQEMVRMPNVVKMDVDEAERELRGMNLSLSKDKMVYSNEVEENRITYQSPKEGSTIKQGETVTVHISQGKEKALLPSVQGIAAAEAKAKLQAAGFHNIKFKEDVKTDGVYGAVYRIEVEEPLKQDKKEGADNFYNKILGSVGKSAPDNQEDKREPLPLDTEITLIICMKEVIVSAAEVSVPAVAGMEKGEAGAALEKLGFQINWVEEASDKLAGTVLRQAPEAERAATAGSYVTLYISQGAEKLYMKNVLLMTQEEARTEIEKLGLMVGELKKDYSDSVAAGKVISQSTAQDTEVKAGDVVSLVISLGRKPEQTAKAPEQDKKNNSGSQQSKRRSEEAEKAKRQSEEAEKAKRQSEEAEKAKRQSEEAEKAKRQSEEVKAKQQPEEAAEAKRQSAAAESTPGKDPSRGDESGVEIGKSPQMEAGISTKESETNGPANETPPETTKPDLTSAD